MRRRLVLAALMATMAWLLAGCALEDALPVPDCVEGESALIVAQSVPTGELVPCLDGLPRGWEVRTVTIDHDGSEVELDSDRAGAGAASLHYSSACEVGDAVWVPTDQPGADAYEFIERIGRGFQADRFYLFDGGCVRWEFDFDAEASATLSIELQDRLSLVPRQALNESIRESFIDEEL